MEKEWRELTGSEKRERRFADWLEAEGVNFEEPEGRSLL